jgi:hypothetical protein
MQQWSADRGLSRFPIKDRSRGGLRSFFALKQNLAGEIVVE